MMNRLLRLASIGLLLMATWAVGTATQADDGEKEGGLTGTGIVGEITALGSIFMQGQRIAFDKDLPVNNVLGPVVADALRPGDIVAAAVTAANEPNLWSAKAITQIHALVGPVTAVGSEHIEVMGVRVNTGDIARNVATNDWVAISGFWSIDAVSATRVEPVTPRNTISLQGSFELNEAETSTRIGPVILGIEPLQHASPGDFITATGTFVSGQLSITDIHLGLFDEPVSVVLAEGYVSKVHPSGHYTILGSGLSSFADRPESVMPAERVRVCGYKGRLIGDDSLVLSDEARVAARRLGCEFR